MEAALLTLNSLIVLIAVVMGLRDDRRPRGTEQRSIFRYREFREPRTKAANSGTIAERGRTP